MAPLQSTFEGLVKSAFVVFVGILVGRGLSLLGELLIIRALDPKQFGLVALVYTGVLLLARLGLLGIPDGLTRTLSEVDIGNCSGDLIRSAYLISLSSGLLLGSGLLVFRPQLAAVMGMDRVEGLIVYFVPFALLFPTAMVSIAILRARKRSVFAVVSKDVGPRIGGIILFGVFAFFGRPFTGAIVYWVSVPVFATALAIWFIATDSARTPSIEIPSIESMRKLWSFSWPLAIGGILLTVMTSIDVLMVGYFLKSESVGFYRSVHPLRQVTEFVLRSFGFLFLPIATEYYSNNQLSVLGDFYRHSTKWIVLLTLPFVLVFSLFSESVVTVFLGPDYIAGALVLSILTSGLFFSALVGPNGAMTKAINQPRIEMYSASVGVVVNVVLNVILIPVFGIAGAAISTVLGFAVYNTLEVVAVYLTLGIQPFSLDSLKPLVITVLAGVSIAWLTNGMQLGLLALVAVGAVLLTVQAFALIVTDSIDQTDRLLINRLLTGIGIRN